jgi:hypothetical protein
MRSRGASILWLALIGAAPWAAHAQEPPVNLSEDIVGLSGSEGGEGRIAVNAAAGNQNQQVNVGVIAIGDNAAALGGIIQVSNAPTALPSAFKSAVIEGDAFAGSKGMIAVAVAAGSNNQQANLAVVALGFEGQVATDVMLSQARASTSPSGGPEQAALPEVVTGVSPGAFAGASGVVQVSLVGGERNSSANIFALTSAEGANP